MGGSDLDLNDAELTDDVVEMTVFSLMGGAESACPKASTSSARSSPSWAATGSSSATSRPDPGGPTLHLRVISIMGGTDVKRGRKLSRAERKRRKHLEHGR